MKVAGKAAKVEQGLITDPDSGMRCGPRGSGRAKAAKQRLELGPGRPPWLNRAAKRSVRSIRVFLVAHPPQPARRRTLINGTCDLSGTSIVLARIGVKQTRQPLIRGLVWTRAEDWGKWGGGTWGAVGIEC